MEQERKATVIALAGKGGVGKTSLSALTVRLLAQRYPDKKILAIGRPEAAGSWKSSWIGRKISQKPWITCCKR